MYFSFVLSEFTPISSVPMLAYKVMPSLLPLNYTNWDATMSAELEMEMESSTPKVVHAMDLTTKLTSSENNTCYRTSSADSLITNGSMDDNDVDNNDVDIQYQRYRPRLPTADMLLVLNKHKRRPLFKVPTEEASFPLNLCTKNDKSSREDGSAAANDLSAESEYNMCSTKDDCSCKCCSKRNKQTDDMLSEQNRFDWSEYRRSMSCSQIDFRMHRKLAASRIQRKFSVNEPSSAAGSSGEASPAELSHDRDDGFHDEVDNSGKSLSSDIRNSPVKRLMNNRMGGTNSFRRYAEDQALSHQDTGRFLMNEPPEAFVHTLEQLSFDNQMQKTKPAAFLQSLTDQYVPHYVKPLNACPVDAYGYYAHLMRRLQTHHVLENNSHHSTPNLSASPTQPDEAIPSDGNYPGISGKKRPPRALTGRHVREGTGASPSTLVSLRKAIEERQKFKKTDVIDRKSFSKKKSGKANSTRPRAYSASLSVARTVTEDAESDTISVASE